MLLHNRNLDWSVYVSFLRLNKIKVFNTSHTKEVTTSTEVFSMYSNDNHSSTEKSHSLPSLQT